MTAVCTDIARLDWPAIATQLDEEGYALLSGLLHPDQVRALASLAPPASGDGDGTGAVRMLRRPLPEPLAAWQAGLGPHLLAIVQRWHALMGRHAREPAVTTPGRPGHAHPWPTPSLFDPPPADHDPATLSRLRAGQYRALHQADAGALQLVALLSEPGRDFTGGELIMTEQRPRMQSRPVVVPLRQGDAALVASAHRPVPGAHGPYRVTMRQAIGRVRSGQRIGLEMRFDVLCGILTNCGSTMKR